MFTSLNNQASWQKGVNRVMFILFSLVLVCKRGIDLGLLIDVSSSRVNIRSIKLFVKRIVKSFVVSTRKTRIGIVLFSSRQRRLIGFANARSSATVNRVIGRIRIIKGRRYIGRALKYVKKYLFAGRPQCGRKRVLIVINGGASVDGVLRPAKTLKEVGVEVFVMLTSKQGVKQMHQIVTSRYHVIHTTYRSIIRITDRLTKKLCHSPKGL